MPMDLVFGVLSIPSQNEPKYAMAWMMIAMVLSTKTGVAKRGSLVLWEVVAVAKQVSMSVPPMVQE